MPDNRAFEPFSRMLAYSLFSIPFPFVKDIPTTTTNNNSQQQQFTTNNIKQQTNNKQTTNKHQ